MRNLNNNLSVWFCFYCLGFVKVNKMRINWFRWKRAKNKSFLNFWKLFTKKIMNNFQVVESIFDLNKHNSFKIFLVHFEKKKEIIIFSNSSKLKNFEMFDKRVTLNLKVIFIWLYFIVYSRKREFTIIELNTQFRKTKSISQKKNKLKNQSLIFIWIVRFHLEEL